MPVSAIHHHSVEGPSVQPILIRQASRPVAAQRIPESARSLVPSAALLAAALLVVAGCRGDAMSPADAERDRSRLAHHQPGVTEPGDAERREAGGGDAVAEAPGNPVFASYPSELPLVGSAAARATVRYGKDRLDVANLSKLPWRDARVWVNRQYSARLPLTTPGEIAKTEFHRLRDENGRVFPSDNSRTRVESVELVLGDERTRVRFGLDH